MCGIFGYVGPKSVDLGKFKTLMLFQEHRAGDSVGVAAGATIVKDTGTTMEFAKSQNLDWVLNENIVIGHGRKATVGAITKATAHPFKSGHIIGMHNGTLKNHAEIASELGLTKPTVDSEVIFSILEKHDIKTLEKLAGAAAIGFYSLKEPNRLVLLRNDKRPLFTGMVDGGIYFSSLHESLVAIGATKITDLPIDTVHQYIYDETTNKVNVITLKEKVKIPFYETYVGRTYYGGTQVGSDYTTRSGYTNYAGSKTKAATVQKTEKTVVKEAQSILDKKQSGVVNDGTTEYAAALSVMNLTLQRQANEELAVLRSKNPKATLPEELVKALTEFSTKTLYASLNSPSFIY